MLEGARVVVVVPAYEEEPRLARVLETMPAFVDAVCVVDDASRDATAEVARRFAPRVELVRHVKNRGVGAAIATGYGWALSRTSAPRDAACVMAGDGQMHPDDLASVALPVVRGACDYGKGDRLGPPHRARGMPFARRAGGAVLSRLTSLAIGQRVRDSQCGFTAIARSALSQLDLSGLYPRFGYPNDLLGQLAARRLRIAEVPVRPVYAGEKSELRAYHAPPIVGLVVRAAIRVRLPRTKKE